MSILFNGLQTDRLIIIISFGMAIWGHMAFSVCTYAAWFAVQWRQYTLAEKNRSAGSCNRV